MTPRKSGFTLIEVLVVVAIIGVLVAMLMPVISYVQERAYKTNCMANLRQLGSAFELYKEKWGGWYPHEDRDGLPRGTSLANGNFSWFDVLDPFIGAEGNLSRVKQCPSWSGYELTAAQMQTADQHSIKMNSRLSKGIEKSPLAGNNGIFPNNPPKGYYYWVPAHLIKKPSHTILLIDGRTDNPGSASQIRTAPGNVSSPHSGGTNILFVDLHVEWFDSTAAGVIKPTGLGWANEGGFIWDALKK